MNLFLDTISPKNALILFDDEKNILTSYFFDVRLQESSLLIGEVDEFLKKNNCSYFDLKKMVVVNGPGSFTGVRTTVLLVNTIAFVNKAELFALSYFDLFNIFPVVKSSSKRDVFFQESLKNPIEVISNDEVRERIQNYQNISGEVGFDTGKNISSSVDYSHVLQKIDFSQPHKRIEPLYLKKPNIC